MQKKYLGMKLEKLQSVYWLSGLSGSGKSTIGTEFKSELIKLGCEKIILLDGDDLRCGINNNLSFSDEDRSEANRRAAEIAKLLFSQGYIVIVATISPFKKDRDIAKKIISKESIKLIFIKASLETCKKRDVKGLYKKAYNGEIKEFTGIDSIYEEPMSPDIVLNTEENNVNECISILFNKIR